jgi:hypothetical protein
MPKANGFRPGSISPDRERGRSAAWPDWSVGQSAQVNEVQRLEQVRTQVLHQAARLFEDENRSLADLLVDLVTLLPPAFQYPAAAAASVTVNDCTAATPGFTLSASTLLAVLGDSDYSISIEVCYVTDGLSDEVRPFLGDERDLLTTLAEMLHVYLRQRQVG